MRLAEIVESVGLWDTAFECDTGLSVFLIIVDSLATAGAAGFA